MNLLQGLLRYAENAGMTAKKAVDKAVPYLDPTNPAYDKIPVLKQTRELSRSLGYDPAMDNSIPFQERLPMYLQKYGEGFMGSHGGLGKAPSKGILPNPIAKRAFQLADEMDAKGNVSIEQTDEVMQMVKDYLRIPEKEANKMTIPQMLQELMGNAEIDQKAAYHTIPQRARQPNVANQSFYDMAKYKPTIKANRSGDVNIISWIKANPKSEGKGVTKDYVLQYIQKERSAGAKGLVTTQQSKAGKGFFDSLVRDGYLREVHFPESARLGYTYEYTPKVDTFKSRVAQESLGDIKDFDIPNLGQSILNVLNKKK